MGDGGNSATLVATKATRTFPSARIRSYSGGLPIEVALIAQLGYPALFGFCTVVALGGGLAVMYIRSVR